MLNKVYNLYLKEVYLIMSKHLGRYTGAIDSKYIELIKYAARKEERPVNYMINRLIKNYCSEFEDEFKKESQNVAIGQ